MYIYFTPCTCVFLRRRYALRMPEPWSVATSIASVVVAGLALIVSAWSAVRIARGERPVEWILNHNERDPGAHGGRGMGRLGRRIALRWRRCSGAFDRAVSARPRLPRAPSESVRRREDIGPRSRDELWRRMVPIELEPPSRSSTPRGHLATGATPRTSPRRVHASSDSAPILGLAARLRVAIACRSRTHPRSSHRLARSPRPQESA